MIRSFLTVSTGTLASRLLGFIRDSMLAALLGAGPLADAFLLAFQLVNVIRRLLTEGALNAALVPAWLRVREGEGAVIAAAFAGRVLGTVSAALIAAAVLIGLLMPLLMTALAPGFAGHPTLQMAVDDARLMLPYLAFAGPVTVTMALMNAQHRFFLTAFSPLLFNIALIAVMGVLIAWRYDAANAALTIAATVRVAGLMHLSILLLGGGGSVASPVRAEDATALARAQSRGLELAVGCALPATLGLIVLSVPIVRMLFEHGVFAASDATATAQMLTWLAFGLPAHVLLKALSPAFFARHDTLTPLLATLKGLAVAIVLAVILGQIFGPSGIAAAIACGAWSSALALIRRGAATFGLSIDGAVRRRLPRIALAALAMGGLLWLAGLLMPALDAHGLAQAALLIIVITGAAAIYGLLLALFGVIGWNDAVSAFRQTALPGLRDEGPRAI